MKRDNDDAAMELMTRHLKADLLHWSLLNHVELQELVERSWVLRSPATPTPELESEFALIMIKPEHLPDLVNAILQCVPQALATEVMQVFLVWGQTIAMSSLEDLTPIERARRMAEAKAVVDAMLDVNLLQANGKPPH